MSTSSVKVAERTLPYMTPGEVAIHNRPEDCWVSVQGRVINLTPVLRRHRNEPCIKPILAFAGKDVSHWFDPKTGNIQHYVHPLTGVEVPFCPYGVIPDVALANELPSTIWIAPTKCPWWRRKELVVGVLTAKVRPLKIINMLCAKETHLDVCCEDTFQRIKERYSMFNTNGDSYVWTCNGKILNMEKTMEENGIPDERELFAKYRLPPSYHVPAVLIFYSDDMKEAEELESEQDSQY